jgi:hypothetical protein
VLLHDEAMLKDRLTVDAEDSIPISINIADAPVRMVTGSAAEMEPEAFDIG